MTDKKQFIYISLLPLVIIVLLIFGAGYFLLADEIKLPKFNKGTQIRRLENFPTIIYTEEGKQYEKQRRVIKSEEELNDFLNYIDPAGLVTLKETVDFNKEYVIGVATEVEDPETHAIKIKKVYEDKDKKSLLIALHETFPRENCTVEVSPHIAVDMVAINKTDWSIDFERVKEEEPCEEENDEATDEQSTPSEDSN
ncbi:hypothetical protein C4561_03100 [candidate division WWE3 bacterium]|jgi:hypothetical protein|uniref:Protease complex subunit PrcB family protein n=1 Tax=candidate division WWE3 bacterium TaxID=2053526 RepID=A0A3A4ZD16_UNCKA|nr:MAG: hypothetical protein C4561_03100 [candidate division WWE3 bacterium]